MRCEFCGFFAPKGLPDIAQKEKKRAKKFESAHKSRCSLDGKAVCSFALTRMCCSLFLVFSRFTHKTLVSWLSGIEILKAFEP